MSESRWLSCAQVRKLDRRAAAEYGLSTLVLMENAGRGATECLRSLVPAGPIVICCGKGNNGGDGLVMARHLDCARLEVKVLLLAAPADLSPGAATNWKIVERSGIAHEAWPTPEDARLRAELDRAAWIVDALYGTGLTGPVRPPLDRVIAAMNAAAARRFAIDIPSGLDGDTGEPLGVAIRADHTATMVAPKKGFVNPAAAAWTGTVHVIDIGMPRRLLDDVMAGVPCDSTRDTG